MQYYFYIIVNDLFREGDSGNQDDVHVSNSAKFILHI